MSSQSRLLVCTLGCVFLGVTGCKSQSSLALSAGAKAAEVSADGGDDAGAELDAGVDAGQPGGINLCGRLRLDRVRVVVRRINLERAPAATDGGADAGAADAGLAFCDCDDDETVCVKPAGDVHIGPFLVDLAGGALDGGIHQIFDLAIPEGTYDDVRFVINTLSRHQAADGGLAEMKDLHASIAAEGTFAGSPFLFTTPMRLQQKQEGPFTVGPGTSNIVLIVDPARWFVGRNGQLLDPRDPMNRGRILADIRCSVRMSSTTRNEDGGSVRREFEDDEDEDRCRAENDDDDHDFERFDGDHGHDGDGGDDHPRDHGHPACAAPPLDCGDGGAPAADAGIR